METRVLVKPLDKQLELLKNELLLVLRNPQLPMHNNQAELDIRERVIKRKISLCNRSMEGVRNWDLSTCRTIGPRFWDYLLDRNMQKEAISTLGKLVSRMD